VDIRSRGTGPPTGSLDEIGCVVPFNSFSEFNEAEGGDIWFALDETRPLA
jgi:hypothetical protein